MLKHGPFNPYASKIGPLIEEFCDPALAATRHLLVHGFCEFHFTLAGDMAVQFRRFVPGTKTTPDKIEKRYFRRSELAAERERLVQSAQAFVDAVSALCLDLGFGDQMDPST
ncbi:hypothetical protein ASD21_18925 [Caulobacter sp. Root1455]|nr:hypothetical protein ASD38_00730 [Caulobacter sp. Root487D2Y]KQZ05741.1 hypothetical protein ASD21_18925 [Caulobacter sp. Root1455]